MEEDDDGKGGGDGGGRGEEAEPEVAGGVDGDVGGFDTVDGVGARGELAVEEVEETAVDGAIGAARGVDEEVEERGQYAKLPRKVRFGGRRHWWW